MCTICAVCSSTSPHLLTSHLSAEVRRGQQDPGPSPRSVCRAVEIPSPPPDVTTMVHSVLQVFVLRTRIKPNIVGIATQYLPDLVLDVEVFQAQARGYWLKNHPMIWAGTMTQYVRCDLSQYSPSREHDNIPGQSYITTSTSSLCRQEYVQLPFKLNVDNL